MSWGHFTGCGCVDEASKTTPTLGLNINIKQQHTDVGETGQRTTGWRDLPKVPYAQCPRPDSNPHVYACESKLRTMRPPLAPHVLLTMYPVPAGVGQYRDRPIHARTAQPWGQVSSTLLPGCVVNNIFTHLASNTFFPFFVVLAVKVRSISCTITCYMIVFMPLTNSGSSRAVHKMPYCPLSGLILHDIPRHLTFELDHVRKCACKMIFS